MRKTNKRKTIRPVPWQQIIVAAITLIAVVFVILNDRRNYSEMKKIAMEQFNKQQLLLAKTAATGMEAYYWELIKEMSSLVETPDIQQMSPGSLHYLQHAYLGYSPRTSIRLLDRNGILRFILLKTGEKNLSEGITVKSRTFINPI